MTKKLGNPSDSPNELIDVDEAISRLVAIQQQAFSLFFERRTERVVDAPTRFQTFVLRTVRERERISVSELAHALSISVPTASQLINTLVERGWLTMDVSPEDRRRHDVRITQAGSEVLRERLEKRLSHVKDVLGQLGPEERTALVTLLERAASLWKTTPDDEGSSEHGHKAGRGAEPD